MPTLLWPHRLAGALILILAAQSAHAAEADSPEIQLQRQLDKPITLTLQNVPISEAFKQIAATAKIPLQIDPSCYELLPYGDTTLVTITFKQSKLREALDVLLVPVGLQTVVTGNAVMIRPASPLLHIGHRATWEELKLLKELWSSPDLKAPASGTFNLADALRAAMESAVDARKDLLVQMPGDSGGAPSPAQEHALEQIARQLPMSAYRALEMYCQLTGNIWFVEAGPLAGGPTGGKIVIMSPRAWINRQLAQPISIARKDEPLEVVVADLTHASGIRFVPEPGLYQAVPVVSLRSDNGTVLQTLEALAGSTRIAFDVHDDSILLHLTAGANSPAAQGDTIVGRIAVPAGDMLMDIYIRQSDLTPEQNELRKRHIEDAVKALQKTWSTPGSPPTAPATTAPAKPE